MSRRFAFFISSHGFGHAARACAVMEAIWRLDDSARFELFTATPKWFFSTSLLRPFGYHAGSVDLGLVQSTALEEDLDATLKALNDEIPFSTPHIDRLARMAETLACDAILCDIAPLGLLVAEQLGCPGVLIENFTWDWIYRGYLQDAPGLAPIIDELARLVELADLHLQTEPSCQLREDAIQIPPISRAPRLPRQDIRQRLGVPQTAPLLMLTMGGIEWDYSSLTHQLDALHARNGATSPWLLIAGGSPHFEHHGHLLRLPHRSDFYHPDLIHAADAVIGKLGYSTLAEVAHAGLPFGYVPRPRFPESPVLETWVQHHLPHLRIDGETFRRGEFLERLDPLLVQIGERRPAKNGGDEIARQILALVTGRRSPSHDIQSP